MQELVLLTCLIISSAGFVIWYTRSSSLRLPVRYQIMYDSNPPYVHRIFRRRLLAMILYFFIPWIVFSIGGYSLSHVMNGLGIQFAWSPEVLKYSLIGVGVTILLGYLNAKKDAGLESYPEIRVRFWTRYIFIISITSWAGYIFCYEIFYRGFLFHAFLYFFNQNLTLSIAATTALYTLTHYWKMNRITFFSFIWSVLSCYMVYRLQSLWPAIIIHLSLSLFFEWFGIIQHDEMHARRV
jgi:hypothetical protein